MTARDIELGPGRRVRVVEAGAGPPVVFLHGTNTSSASLLPVLEHLDDVRAIAVDRPGFGASDRVPAPRRRFRDAAVEFIDEVLDALVLARPALAGNSMGGTWALWYALARPERVRQLVLLGSAPLLPGTRAPAPLRAMATPVLGDLLAKVAKPDARMVVRLMSSMGEGETIVRYPDLIASLVAAGRDPVATAVNLAELRAVLTPIGFRRSAVLEPDELRRLSVPTLLIWGDDDPVATVDAARATADLIPEARLEVLPGGHVPYLGNPERVSELLTEFVGSRV
jgi:pimeloyl-ACP methyl ester carboxylesterase